MRWCSRCGSRLFSEDTPDGEEWIDLNGHRFSAAVPLDIPAKEPTDSKRQPRMAELKMVRQDALL